MGKLVVFDLDGTLIDSRKDLANSVNFMRQQFGLPAATLDEIVSFVGNGAAVLIKRATAEADQPIDFNAALKCFKEHYAKNLVVETSLYPGVAEGLRKLRESGCFLTVVTNKPSPAARSILKLLKVDVFLDEIVGGDSQYPLKPEPDALLAFQKKYDIPPENCFMVGDHYTDLEAGRRAGFKRIMASYGFGEAREEHPDFTAASFDEVVNIIG